MVAGFFLINPYSALFAFSAFVIWSYLAGRCSQDPRATTLTVIMSALSFFTLDAAFPYALSVRTDFAAGIIASAFLGGVAFILERSYPNLWQKKVERRHLLSTAKMIASLCAVIFVVWLAFANYTILLQALDSHPWIIPVVIAIFSFIGGRLFEKRRKQTK
jgi:hypothetical protein